MISFFIIPILASIWLVTVASDGCIRADKDKSTYGGDNGVMSSFIVVEACNCGLSNRLGLIAAALHIADLRNIPFVVSAWHEYNEVKDPSSYPDHGHFLELFQPIPNLVFIHQNIEQRFRKDSIKSLPECRGYHFEDGVKSCGCGVEPDHDSLIRQYSKFVLTWENNREIQDFVRENKICSTAAIHIRRTDLLHTPTTDEHFLRFVRNLPHDQKVFIMTDNNDTRQKFIRELGSDRVITYGSFSDHAIGRPRHTSIRHFIVEAMIATHAKVFMGTETASSSDLVNIFREVNRVAINESCSK